MRADLYECAGGADRFVVVDTETTGVYTSDRVVELAIITLTLDGDVVDVFDTLINPCREVSASHIHGITASMVADAPTFEEIAGDVAVRLHGACLVAHNVPFDKRMLANEFERLGEDLVVERAVDTYVGSASRLIDACAQHGIDLSGAHRASTDAHATAQLFLRLMSACGDGRPIAAPLSMHRTGRVRRRDDVAAVCLPDTPLIAYLASRLPFNGLAVHAQEYLEVVGRAVADLHLDREERAELAALAAAFGLSDAQVTQAHRRFVNELVDAAIADDVVTDDEYEMLVRVAAGLSIEQDTVERRIASFRTTEATTTLQPGMQVVFTGDHPRLSRAELNGRAAEMGLVPKGNVSMSTGLVCAVDAKSQSGKAKKARQYGIPLLTVDEFVAANIGDALTGAATAAALKVITCPDCHVTWTVPATTRASTSKRCDSCASLTNSSQSPDLSPVEAPGPVGEFTGWAPPAVEWLTCRRCTTAWTRQRTRGRKPHFCPKCTGADLPAPPADTTVDQSGS